jgi:hypothetical protein
MLMGGSNAGLFKGGKGGKKEVAQLAVKTIIQEIVYNHIIFFGEGIHPGQPSLKVMKCFQ